METIHDSPHEPRRSGIRRAETDVATEPMTRAGSQIDQAMNLIRELLADGPAAPRDVKAEAEARGLRICDKAWDKARQRLALESIGSGNRWWWQLPGSRFEDELADWLVTPSGCFATYYAERERGELEVEAGSALVPNSSQCD
jgi:hypothetical protein